MASGMPQRRDHGTRASHHHPKNAQTKSFAAGRFFKPRQCSQDKGDAGDQRFDARRIGGRCGPQPKNEQQLGRRDPQTTTQQYTPHVFGTGQLQAFFQQDGNDQNEGRGPMAKEQKDQRFEDGRIRFEVPPNASVPRKAEHDVEHGHVKQTTKSFGGWAWLCRSIAEARHVLEGELWPNMQYSNKL